MCLGPDFFDDREARIRTQEASGDGKGHHVR